MPPCGQGLGCQVLDVVTLATSSLVDPVGRTAAALGQDHPAFWPVAAALVGAVAASLSGLVVDRLPRILGWDAPPERALSLSHPPSRCDACGDRLSPLALIPVAGWVAARGRCESCFEPVPPVYPIVEGGTAVASIVVASVFGPSQGALCGCLLLWALVAASWLDWREKVIPDGFTVPMFFAGLLLSPFEPDAWARGSGALLAMGLAWVTFRIVSSVKDVDAMAVGDVALATAMGAWLGACAVPVFLILSSACYMAYAIPLRLRFGQVWVPMGPGLSAGFLVALLTGWRFAL